MPAFEIRASSRPHLSSAAATMAFPPAGVATLSKLATASPPWASISATTRAAADASDTCPSGDPPRSLTTNFAPAAAGMDGRAVGKEVVGRVRGQLLTGPK